MRSLAILVALLAACDQDHVPPPTPRDARAVARVIAAPDAAPVKYVGVITAAESVDIAPRFQGVIAEVKVRSGDVVKAGDIVASMDRKTMEEELRAAQAAYGAAIAAARQTQVDVEDAKRKEQLEAWAVQKGVSPKANLDEATLGVKRAQAAALKADSVAAQEGSHVQTAKDHLADLQLRAPSDGTVAMRFKDPGSTVTAGTAIVRLVGKGGLRLRFAVPPDRAQALAVGQVVHAQVDTVTEPLAATIRQVSPTLDPSSGTILVEADFAADAATSSQLRPGLAAWVR